MAAFAAGGGGGAQLAAGEGEIIASVIFFDNDIRNCQDMIKNVKNCASVYVDDRTKLDEYTSGKDYMEKQATAENIYAQITMRELGHEPHICKGITDEIISENLNPWIERTQGVENRFAVFDWDRTISVVEGLVIPSRFPYKGIAEDEFIAHMTTYVLGGDARIQMLQSMYEKIIESGTQVVILTNNPSAMPTLDNTRQRNTFLKMIENIFPNFVEKNLLCSNRSPSKSYRINQYLAPLRSLGGGKKKRTKTRRKTKTRRNTKKRQQKHR